MLTQAETLSFYLFLERGAWRNINKFIWTSAFMIVYHTICVLVEGYALFFIRMNSKMFNELKTIKKVISIFKFSSNKNLISKRLELIFFNIITTIIFSLVE